MLFRSAAVPTVWLGLLQHMEANGLKLPHLKKVVIGGSAVPERVLRAFEVDYGVEVYHAWGMTETNPLGTLARVKENLGPLDDDARLAVSATQGYAVPFVDVRHADDQGKVLPWDGQTMGELEVRGPWVAAGYLGGEGAEKFTADGWFKTGDVEIGRAHV